MASSLKVHISSIHKACSCCVRPVISLFTSSISKLVKESRQARDDQLEPTTLENGSRKLASGLVAVTSWLSS